MNRETIIQLARDAKVKPLLYDGKWAVEGLDAFAALVEDHLKSQGYRQCAKGQRTTQYCGMVEQAVKAEREKCAMDREFFRFFFTCMAQFCFGMFMCWMLLVAAAWLFKGLIWIVN